MDGIVVFRPLSSQVVSTLNSHDEVEFSWNQLKNNGEQILEGSYKIMSVGFDDNKNIMTFSLVTITIYISRPDVFLGIS